jgi:hypothetical protein
MKFFDDPSAPAPPPPPPRRPEWYGPPEGWLGGYVPVRIILARTPDVVVSLGPLEAFPDGVSFELRTTTRQISDGHDPLERSSGGLRLGVALADGSKWQGGQAARFPSRPATGPILVPGGGGGSDHNYTQNFWLWPLPPPGPVTFALTWPGAGIDEVTTQIDAALLRTAATQAQKLWDPLTPEEEQAAITARFAARARHRPPGSSFGTMTAVRVDDDNEEDETRPKRDPDDEV